MVETCIPLNDDFDNAFEIPSATYTTTQHYMAIRHATVASDDPEMLPYGPVKEYTVWYHFTPVATGGIQIDTLASDYDTVLAVWTGARGSLTQVVVNDDSGGGSQSEVQFLAEAGTTYYIEVAGYDQFEFGTLELNVTDSVTLTCNTLSLSNSGSGAVPTAVPTSSSGCAPGKYVPGEEITLTAAPDSGWEVSGWSGTIDNDSTATTNTVIMSMNMTHFASVTYVASAAFLFTADFETGDLSQWTRFNDGGGWLYACGAGAITDSWGACIERGDNDKRKQLIDETPVDQTSFNTRFNFDINSLAMGEGVRFRFMQVKWGAERPFFIVLRYESGQYEIQLNTLLDDLTKVKTAWYVLTDEPHVIEVGWQAASGAGANDGFARLYLDDVLLQELTGLDNDSLWIESFRVGFTSRLEGKVISGMFYVDDVATSNNGYIGPP
jgi:hypothetical protein